MPTAPFQGSPRSGRCLEVLGALSETLRRAVTPGGVCPGEDQRDEWAILLLLSLSLLLLFVVINMLVVGCWLLLLLLLLLLFMLLLLLPLPLRPLVRVAVVGAAASSAVALGFANQTALTKPPK